MLGFNLGLGLGVRVRVSVSIINKLMVFMLRTAVLPPTVKPVLTAGDPQVSAAGCWLAIHDVI